MSELAALVASVGVPAVVVLLILDRVKGIVKNSENSKPSFHNTNPGTQQQLIDVLRTSVEQHGEAAKVMSDRLGEQTRLMQKMCLTQERISVNQDNTAKCLERVERKLENL